MSSTIRLNKQTKTIKVVNRKGTLSLKKDEKKISLKHTGKVGPQGQTGPQGPRGYTGPQGPTGAAITVLGTLANSAALPQTGNAGDAYIIGGDLWVWTGTQWTNGGSIQGPTGVSGAAGNTGSTGPQGNQGIMGATGPQGVQGIQGEAGTTGVQGATGPQGIQGVAGASGAQGTQGVQGATGVKGDSGATGPQGTQGIQGVIGATGVQGNQGSTGPQGVQGTQGFTGAQGIQGTQGATGAQGIQGATGSQGVQGTQGYTGPQGTAGGQGATGATGFTGPQGTAGAVGATGASGAQGSTGVAGQSFRWEGTWTSTTTYLKDDVVIASNGDNYISKADGNLAQDPVTDTIHTYWDVMIVRGADGGTGPTGAQGSAGATGAQGATGVAGATGPAGPTGPQGIVGPAGSTGPQGIQGTAGFTGATGNAGFTGATGAQGLYVNPTAPTDTNVLWLDTDDSVGSAALHSIVAGANVTVDNTDPFNPIVSASGGGGGGTSSAPTPTITRSLAMSSSEVSLYSAGSSTFDVDARRMYMHTGSAAGGIKNIYWDWNVSSGWPVFRGTVSFAFAGFTDIVGSDFDMFVGVGDPGITASQGTAFNLAAYPHFGFRRQQTAGGGIILSCTQSDGTGETSVVITDPGSTQLLLGAVKSQTDIKYYVNGALAATLTTHAPTDAITAQPYPMNLALMNNNVATLTRLFIFNYTYTQQF